MLLRIAFSMKHSHATRCSRPLHLGPCLGAIAALFVATSPAATARATPELPPAYSARFLGLGGSGVALADDASAIYLNPAGLNEVKSFDLSLTLSPFLPQLRAPVLVDSPTFGNPEIQRLESDRALVPLFYLGAALRVTDFLVIGAAAYTVNGAGARYRISSDLSASLALALIELAVPLTFRVTDTLSIGASLRVGYGFFDLNVPSASPLGGLARLKQSGSGFGRRPGVTIGIRYRPRPDLSLAMAYRSPLIVDLDLDQSFTDIRTGMRAESTATTESAAGHALRAGVVYEVLDSLLVSCDLFYTRLEGLYDNDALDWRDSMGGSLGVEFAPVDFLPLRVGYSPFRSGTDASAANAFAPPGLFLHVVTAGIGLKLASISLDLAGAYGIATGISVSADKASNNPVTGNYAGDYAGNYGMLSLSFAYHM